MKRTKQWWASLTPEERSELHWLEWHNSKWSIRNSIFQPGECRECEICHKHCLEAGICPTCHQRLDFLIKKADQIMLAAATLKTNN
jgi:Pyruvate/2-oxoacid:ferredoxin oxidoreductase delta subunit